MSRTARTAVALVVMAVLVVAAGTAVAQFRGRARVRLASPESFDGRFSFCRVMFRSSRDGDGGGWGVDYPYADTNVLIRLSELTKIAVSFDPSGEPNHFVLRLIDDELFQCPFVMMTEVGSAYFDQEEAARLRDYLLKGGFVWADDFWGPYAWSVWLREIRKALPATEYPIVDLPKDHPLYRTQFVIPGVPQIASINFWRGSGGGTSERGLDRSRQPYGRAILDPHGRVMVFMTHNTDIGDSWEREGEDPDYFYEFSVKGYALGINVVLYALTH